MRNKKDIYNIKIKNRWYQKIINICLALFLIIEVLIFVGVSTGLKLAFDRRAITPDAFRLTHNDFENLTCENYKFKNDCDVELAGYLYSKPEVEKKSILFISNGIGGGHYPYLNIINFFTGKGYYVFAYDGMGCDDSPGSIKGLTQGLLDLKYAISFGKELDKCDELPITLLGHSWGGYAVTHVLEYYPEVKGVVEIAGFDTNYGLLEAYGDQFTKGVFSNTLGSIDACFEKDRFGDYANISAIPIIKNSDAHILFLSGEKDTTIPPSCGFDIWKNSLPKSDKYKFILREDRDHGNVLENEFAVHDYKAFIKGLDEYVKSPKNRGRDANEVKQEYYDKYWTKDRYKSYIDTEFCSEVETFLDNSLKA